jgi:hypothetical protein
LPASYEWPARRVNLVADPADGVDVAARGSSSSQSF